ncbi:MAG: Cbb3-type cytochrome c oxidase subunit 3 [Gammaproteobacteria bacterium]|nr:Cbb3-type cytochrome c oxidase subunit 3 [Gammaproteobacteria bacterium]
MSIILSVWTVIVLLLFLGIVVWAWHANNKADFEAAARIPFDDDDGVDQREGNMHG